jgi:phosphoribosyl 1,2-cyclic phosphate phosphodiesterase
MSLRITVLGSGTSSGVPTIGCSCPVCLSTDARDKRLRPSILISTPAGNIVVDTTPDFRAQVLRAKPATLDAIIYTHSHADHILGLDDVRPFNYHQGTTIPIYAFAPVLKSIRRVFEYIFKEHDPRATVPKIEVHELDGNAFDVLDLRFQPIPVIHGKETIHGFRFGNAAYLTDHSEVPESSQELLRGLDVLFLDALRRRPHPTHSTLDGSIALAQHLGAKRTYFTHMCHDLPHAETEASLPEGVHLAWDGLELEVETEA